MPVVSIITDPMIGGTFLTWSLYWLSGQNNYFYFKNKQQVPLCNDPLTNINAHNFLPNQPNTLSEVRDCYDILKSRKSNDVDYVYFHNLRNEHTTDTDINGLAIDIAFKDSIRCIVLDLPEHHFLYKIKQYGRSLTTKFNSKENNNSFDEQNQDFLDHFYHEDVKYWRETLKSTEIWDQREFLALNLRPFDQQTIDKRHLLAREYFLLTGEDCWFCLDKSIIDLFEFLDITIDSSRWQQWVNIFQRWNLFHYERMKFSWYFDEIIDAILNGTMIDLKRFNLDLYRESVIQHVLLYRHNLNLRTYKVTKFQNTLQLHHLLEPNIYHKLERIY